LRLLLQQNEKDINILAIFDALDEYDGQPDFICRFLKDLQKATIGSRTTLKILFSSRPWDRFRDHFKAVPSIQIQDYTKEDMYAYCTGMVEAKQPDISRLIRPLVPQILSLADGVFLWTNLVLQECKILSFPYSLKHTPKPIVMNVCG
jgi:hypothetical protein